MQLLVTVLLFAVDVVMIQDACSLVGGVALLSTRCEVDERSIKAADAVLPCIGTRGGCSFGLLGCVRQL